MSMIGKVSRLSVSILLIALVISGCKTVDVMKAEVMLEQEKYDEVISILEPYVASNPDAIRQTSKLGFAYLKTGRIDESIATLKKALDLQPGEPHATLYLGVAYLNKGRFDETIRIWQGFADPTKPLVEAEIKRLTTLIQIAESQRAAKKAVANEKQMQNVTLDPKTVAVCYYKDLSGNRELQGFQKGLAAMVISDLSKIESLTIVERLRMQALLQEMKLGQTGIVDPSSAPRIGRLVGAENLIVGTLSGEIQVATTLASANANQIRGTTTATIGRSDFFEIPKGIVLDTAKIMGIQLSDAEKIAIGTPHTKNYAAVIHYGLALDALDAGNWETAQNLFTKALMEDPRFELAQKGGDGCPAGGSPSMASLASMSSSQVASMADAAIGAALASQAAADESAKESGAGGGGGGGGH